MKVRTMNYCKRAVYCLAILCVSFISVKPQAIPIDSLYFGESRPGNTPVLFAPGKISLPGRRETKLVFSPTGNECLLGIGESGTFKILYAKYDSTAWSTPQPAFFITNSRAQEPFFSPDGKKMFFTSLADIYECDRVEGTWGLPVKFGSPVNSAAEEYHPTITLDGTLYFCSMREDPGGRLYRSRYVNGGYPAIERLDKFLPCPYSAFDPYIAPDESYIIFSSIYPNGYGNEDQYISYYRNGRFTFPKNLGPKINTSKIEYGSYVSPDGKYYFFSRPDGWGTSSPADIYWVSTGFIDSLKHTNFPPYLLNQIPAQAIQTGTAFNYKMPDSVFYDDDGNNTLRFSASQSNGNSLPSWLVFDSTTCTFSGTSAAAVSLSITITATDTAGAKASCTFTVSVTNSILDGKTSHPATMKLLQNYPNPFNPSTTIEFTVPKSGRYTLRIFSPLGQLVKVISDKEYSSGSHKEICNMDGLPSGVYFYQLQGGNSYTGCKMIFIQ